MVRVGDRIILRVINGWCMLTPILLHSLDFVLLIYGLSFFALAAVSFSMPRSGGAGLFWKWLGFFGVIHGLHEWLCMLVPALGDSFLFSIFRGLFLLVSFVYLMEFGRRSVIWVNSYRAGVWIYLPAFIFIPMGFQYGLSGMVAMVCYFLAIPGSLMAALALWQWGAPKDGRRRELRHIVAPLSMACYGILAGLIVPKTCLFPATIINADWVFVTVGVPVEMIRCLMAVILVMAIWWAHVKWRKGVFPHQSFRRIYNIEALGVLVILLVLGSGWLMTERAAWKYRAENELLVSELAQSLATSLDPEMVASVAKPPAGLPSVAHAGLLKQCQRLANRIEGVRTVSLVIRAKSEGFRFVVDVESSKFKDQNEGPLMVPGTVCEESVRAPEIKIVFDEGIPMVRRYFMPNWAEIVTTISPVFDEGGRKVVGVLCIDQVEKMWNKNISYQRLTPIVATMLLIVLMMVFLSIWRHSIEQGEIRNIEVQRERAQNDALLSMALSEASVAGNVFIAARDLSEQITRVLEIDQAGVWLYTPGAGELRAEDVYVARTGSHLSGAVVSDYEKYPKFHAALLSGRALASDDCAEDPRLVELKEYFARQGIRSILTAPLWVSGEMAGMMMFVMETRIRQWRADELRFAAEAADQMAHVIVNANRTRAEAELAAARTDLEIRVNERTEELFRKNKALRREMEERARLENERRLLESRVQQTQKLESLGVMAGGVAHDFNNILMAILGNVELAKSEAAPSSVIYEYLEDIDKAALRAADLSRQMLAYSGRGHVVINAVDLNKMVHDLGHMLEISVGKKARLEYDLEPNIPTVDGDPTQLSQLVMNLVINAAEAVGNEAGTVTLKTGTLWCDSGILASFWLKEQLPEGKYVFLDVTDTGCGMDEKTISLIFDPFFTTKFTGRGLGLAAVLGIVRGHRGSLDVHSEVGRGTTFRIIFPEGSIMLEQPPADFSGELPVTQKIEGCVLLVDDEAPVRLVAKKLLEHLGLEVIQAADGQEAVDLYVKYHDRIECVLMDLTMPRLDGVEAIRELKRIAPDVKVILCSGFSEDDVVSRFPEWKPSGFLQKPYMFEALAARLRAILG